MNSCEQDCLAKWIFDGKLRSIDNVIVSLLIFQLIALFYDSPLIAKNSC